MPHNSLINRISVTSVISFVENSTSLIKNGVREIVNYVLWPYNFVSVNNLFSHPVTI